MIKDIALFILSESGSPWTLGANFFVGHLPLKTASGGIVPTRCAVILERVPSAVVGDLPDRADKMIQVWNRSKSYTEASDDARDIFALLHGATGIDLPDSSGGSGSSFLAMTIDAVGSPVPIANPGEDGLFEFSANYLFRIEGNPAVP